jgi:hypothetical protein
MALQVVSKKDGFRRAGIAHTGVKVYRKGELTKAQEKSIRAEPMLVSTDVAEPPEAGDAAEATAKKGSKKAAE